MKKILLLALFGLSANVFSAVNDYVVTSTEVLGQIHVYYGTYYFQSQDHNWSTTNCPNARYAYIPETNDGAKAILSTALMARSNNLPVAFSGLCGSTSGDDTYIRVSAIYLP
jgi:hypothetical protein